MVALFEVNDLPMFWEANVPVRMVVEVKVALWEVLYATPCAYVARGSLVWQDKVHG